MKNTGDQSLAQDYTQFFAPRVFPLTDGGPDGTKLHNTPGTETSLGTLMRRNVKHVSGKRCVPDEL